MRFALTKYILFRSVRYLSSRDASATATIRFYSDKKGKIQKKEVSFETMGQTHDSQVVESKWYDFWESQGYFKPKEDGKVCTFLLPPPNLTGSLHLGHALTITVQDVFVRWMRMKGKNVVWIPGFDHAGIALQLVVEKYLQKQLNVTKHDLGKDEFLRKISDWTTKREKEIIRQMRQLGASLDWSRKYFTMDNTNSEAVTAAFLHLYDKGLVYRHSRLVNWSISLRSAVSEFEIQWKQVEKPCGLCVPGYEKPVQFGEMHTIVYKIWNGKNTDDEVLVATTRPETMLGDTAIAVHPDDARYSHLRNKFVWHPIRKCKIPIIFDKCVNSKIGTGALKVTPAHSPQDFEISQRHNLEILDVFDLNGFVREIEAFSNFGGMKRFDVRAKLLHQLAELGLYKGKVPQSMLIPLCSRTGDVIEYIKKSQWYLKCCDMYEKVRKAILQDHVKIEPEYCTNIMFEWFRQGKDWNLSRQIWWGHQIPMYECQDGDKKVWIGAKSPEDARLKASNKLETNPDNLKVTQDPDVLDTWFSSGILPFSVCGWPKELSPLYPLHLMETGSDIVNFWVCRMLMLGMEITGRVPFPKVILHGMVCDSYGRKMSKSLGNVIMPEYIINGISLQEMQAEAEKSFSAGLLTANELQLNQKGQAAMFPSGIPKSGADPLRLALCSNTVKADRASFDLKVVKAYNNFCNKIWNATIYLIRSVQNQVDLEANITNCNLLLMDEWILSRLASTIEIMDKGISDFSHHSAVYAFKTFFGNEFCSIYLESTKTVLKTGSKEDIKRVIAVLFTCLETSYRLLSPFMPFVTEELYHCLPRLRGFTRLESLTVAEYPDPIFWARYKNLKLEQLFSKYMLILNAIRSSRSQYELKSQMLKVKVTCPVDFDDLFSEELTNFVKNQGGLTEFIRADGEISHSNAIVLPIEDCTVYLYHKHTKSALNKIFGPILLEETKLKQNLEALKSKMSVPNYKNQTSSDLQVKHSTSLEKCMEKLEKIEKVKQVIENAQ